MKNLIKEKIPSIMAAHWTKTNNQKGYESIIMVKFKI